MGDILCGNNAGLTMQLTGSGIAQGKKYTVYVADDVALTTATRYKVVEFTAPIVGPSGVNLYMCADGFNVDGSNSKRSVDGKWLVIQDSSTGTPITVGFTNAVLA